MERIEQDAQVETPTFSGWAVVEIMGHRKLAGLCSEVRVAGATMLRVDSYRPGEAAPSQTDVFSSAAIFAIHPAAEGLCRAFTAGNEPPPPVARYELPAPPRRVRPEEDDDEGEITINEDAYFRD